MAYLLLGKILFLHLSMMLGNQTFEYSGPSNEGIGLLF